MKRTCYNKALTSVLKKVKYN